MRLIDADALKKLMEEECAEECAICCYANSGDGCRCNLIENAPTVELTEEQAIDKLHETGWLIRHDKEMTERPKGEIVIKCKDCKYQVKEWREDKRMKDKGFWVYGCEHFGDIMGYWGFGGNDNEFCSDAEQKGGAE